MDIGGLKVEIFGNNNNQKRVKTKEESQVNGTLVTCWMAERKHMTDIWGETQGRHRKKWLARKEARGRNSRTREVVYFTHTWNEWARCRWRAPLLCKQVWRQHMAARSLVAQTDGSGWLWCCWTPGNLGWYLLGPFWLILPVVFSLNDLFSFKINHFEGNWGRVFHAPMKWMSKVQVEGPTPMQASLEATHGSAKLGNSDGRLRLAVEQLNAWKLRLISFWAILIDFASSF